MGKSHATALEILKRRTGQASDVTLSSGRVVRVYNVACGYDLDDPVAHITTNISPVQDVDPAWDFFLVDDVVRIVDPENGAVWFERPDCG